MTATITQLKSLIYTDINRQSPVMLQCDKYSLTKISDTSVTPPLTKGFTAKTRASSSDVVQYWPPAQVPWYDTSLDADTNPAFSPLQLNPYIWIDPSGHKDVVSTTIAKIYDQSGNADANRNVVDLLDLPTFTAIDSGYNGHTTVTTTYQKLLECLGAVSIPAPYTIFFVGQSGTAHGADTYQQYVFSNDTADVIFGKKVADSKLYLGSLAGPTAAVGKGLSVGVMNGASSKIYVNSKTAGATGNPTQTTLTNLSFGGEEAGANSLEGKIANIMICPYAVSNTNIGLWFDFMSVYYGVTLV